MAHSEVNDAKMDDNRAGATAFGLQSRLRSEPRTGDAIKGAVGREHKLRFLSGPRDLVTTDYGRLIVLKIGLLAGMLGIAAVNKFYLTPQLPERAAMRALQRNSLAEFIPGLCVLVFVGMLGTMSPTAHTHATPEGLPPDAAFVHIHAPEAMAAVTIDPGRPGSVQATIRVMREDLSLFPVKGCAFVSNRRR